MLPRCNQVNRMEIQELRELLADDPDDPLLHYVLGTRLMDEDGGDVREAAEHFEAVVEKDPRHVASYLALGQAYLRLDREDAARDVLERGHRLAQKLHHGEGGDLAPEFEDLLESI